jgi:3-methyladenine DNA glycosylase AlkD
METCELPPEEEEMITVAQVMATIASERNEQARAGMARYGINVENAAGMSMPRLRALGKEIVAELGRKSPARHDFALGLWATGSHEARILAALVDLPQFVTADQMDSWVVGLDSWDVCDQLCMNLLYLTELAWSKALEWTARPEEFVKRAGFALIAVIAWKDKKAPDEAFVPFLEAIEREAGDDRNFVKKAVSWALRHVGKRNDNLRPRAVEVARRLAESETRAARWVGKDALKELAGEAGRPPTTPDSR